MRTDPVTITPAHLSDGLYFVYFWIGTITDPDEAWEAMSPRVSVIHDLQRAPGLVANVHVTRLKDISADATVKIEVLPMGTDRKAAEGWIDTPAGKAWARGVVGGSLCSIVLAIPR